MKQLIAMACAGCVAAVIAATMPGGASAQPAADPSAGPDAAAGQPVAPPQGLETVAQPAGLPRLTLVRPTGGVVHLRPNPKNAALVRNAAGVHNANSWYSGGDPPLVYHQGGRVMPNAIIYAILWAPPSLQNGAATQMSAQYKQLMQNLAADFPGNSLDNINTQYFMTIGGKTTFIKNEGRLAGVYVDSSPYPASGCSDVVTPGNCLTDDQIVAEIQKVMQQQKWNNSINHLFLIYTSSGEGSCFDSTSEVCAYTDYCSYHGYVEPAGRQPLIYANIPYGNPVHCQVYGAPSPHNNPAADTALAAAAHEITEAITDPLLDAWYTANLGYENADLCAYDYGKTLSWLNGKANQMWNGHFYLLDTSFDNHAFGLKVGGCVQVGPRGSAPSTGFAG